jgi:energy-coupling factor transporter transmembrane protein EcfT
MSNQNFANHKRFVAGYHYVLTLLVFVGFILAIVNVVKLWATDGLMSAILILLLFTCLFFVFWYMRTFPIKAQDRAIRAEETLRYFILTRQQLSQNLTIAQIAALRFASDEEFVQLVERTLNENLQPNDIKMAVQKWKADHHRV